MAKVYCALIRHGEFERPDGVPSAHLPHPLTPKGREQAVKGAHRVLDMAAELGADVDTTIECSPLRRAVETAELLAGELSAQLETPFTLNEHVDLMERGMGSGANLTIERIEEIVRDDPRFEDPPDGWRRLPHYRLPLPGAESQMEAGARAAARIRMGADEVRRTHERDTIRLFLAHGGSLRHASVVLGVTPLERIAQLSMDYVQPVVLEAKEDDGWAHVLGEWKRRVPLSAVGDVEDDEVGAVSQGEKD